MLHVRRSTDVMKLIGGDATIDGAERREKEAHR